MPQYITDFLVSVFAPVLVSAVTMILAFYGRRLMLVGVDYLSARMGQEEWAKLSKIVDDVVHGIEQSPQFKDMLGSAKKETAMLLIRQFARATGITMTEQQVDILIEAAVSRLNAPVALATVG